MTRVCRCALKTRALVVSWCLCLGSVEHSVPVEWPVDERARAICSHATGSFIASTRHKWQVSTRWIPEIITNHEDQPEPKRRPYLPLHQRSVHRYPFSYLSGWERYCCRGRRPITCTTGIPARGCAKPGKSLVAAFKHGTASWVSWPSSNWPLTNKRTVLANGNVRDQPGLADRDPFFWEEQRNQINDLTHERTPSPWRTSIMGNYWNIHYMYHENT